jgi:hypothetical protein
LHADLQAKGVRCWFAPHDIQPSKKIHEQIDEAIRRLLFPISLVSFDDVKQWDQFDGDLGDDSAKEIREYFIPDFSGWKNQDLYQSSFERLLAALKDADRTRGEA